MLQIHSFPYAGLIGIVIAFKDKEETLVFEGFCLPCLDLNNTVKRKVIDPGRNMLT